MFVHSCVFGRRKTKYKTSDGEEAVLLDGCGRWVLPGGSKDHLSESRVQLHSGAYG